MGDSAYPRPWRPFFDLHWPIERYDDGDRRVTSLYVQLGCGAHLQRDFVLFYFNLFFFTISLGVGR